MTTQFTKEDKKRIYREITNTISLIMKENKISYDLRKIDRVKKWEIHLSRLYKMLELNTYNV